MGEHNKIVKVVFLATIGSFFLALAVIIILAMVFNSDEADDTSQQIVDSNPIVSSDNDDSSNPIVGNNQATDSTNILFDTIINRTDLVECKRDSDYSAKKYCDADGKEIKREDYDINGNLESYFLTSYDDTGTAFKSERYDINGNLEFYVFYTLYDDNLFKLSGYDANGNLIDVWWTDANGNEIE